MYNGEFADRMRCLHEVGEEVSLKTHQINTTVKKQGETKFDDFLQLIQVHWK